MLEQLFENPDARCLEKGIRLVTFVVRLKLLSKKVGASIYACLVATECTSGLGPICPVLKSMSLLVILTTIPVQHVHQLIASLRAHCVSLLVLSGAVADVEVLRGWSANDSGHDCADHVLHSLGFARAQCRGYAAAAAGRSDTGACATEL